MQHREGTGAKREGVSRASSSLLGALDAQCPAARSLFIGALAAACVLSADPKQSNPRSHECHPNHNRQHRNEMFEPLGAFEMQLERQGISKNLTLSRFLLAAPAGVRITGGYGDADGTVVAAGEGTGGVADG